MPRITDSPHVCSREECGHSLSWHNWAGCHVVDCVCNGFYSQFDGGRRVADDRTNSEFWTALEWNR